MTSELIPVHIVSLGCARNDVDSEELAGRLSAGGFELVADPEAATAIVVNTCGFIEQAKKDSVDELLAAADLKSHRAEAVIAVGCMAERYGSELAQALPEADAVLGFDDYPDIAARVKAVLAGDRPPAPAVQDRRKLLPITPIARHDREASANSVAEPVFRRRLGQGPSAAIKIASGCDRRCAFCAIPRFRGSYLSRPIADIVAETQWLVSQGVKEAFLVSENTSSYGKDLPGADLEILLDQLCCIDGLEWIRLSYLQPAEIKPSLIRAIATTPKVVPYFDLSFQHASGALLRSMRRFGDSDSFLALIDSIRAQAPHAGIRSNVIVGFPGETEADISVLCDFLIKAQLDAVGVFAYSDEEDTEGVQLPGHLDADEIMIRQTHVSDLVAELVTQRAEDRIGEQIEVLVEDIADDGVRGRAHHQGPEVDGITQLDMTGAHRQVGDIVSACVVAHDGVDLVAEESK